MGNYSIMTFNLKNDSLFTNRNLKWETRKQSVLEVIQQYQPDIIGVQELTAAMSLHLQYNLSDYTIVGDYRNKKWEIANERNAILFKTKRFELLETKTFWLSSRPDDQGSKVWASLFPRICTMATLKDLKSLDVVSIFNTHLDHLLPYVRSKECKYLSQQLTASSNAYQIVMGDLNTTYNSHAIQILSEEQNNLKSVYTSFEEAGSTIHNPRGKLTRSKYPIDHIFVSKLIKVVNTTIIKDKFAGLYPSDHYPVMSVIEIPRQII